MSSSSDENSVSNNGVLDTLVKHLKNFPVLLEKSQVPSIKAKKTEALKELTKLYATNGLNIDEKSCLKKIANLKKRVKDKSDVNKTGNKRMKLLPHERTLHEIMNRAEEPNPTIRPPSCKFQTITTI